MHFGVFHLRYDGGAWTIHFDKTSRLERLIMISAGESVRTAGKVSQEQSTQIGGLQYQAR